MLVEKIEPVEPTELLFAWAIQFERRQGRDDHADEMVEALNRAVAERRAAEE